MLLPHSSDDSSLVVLKLGGSLLSLPDLAVRVDSVIAERTRHQCLLVAGGGKAADIVRQWSEEHLLSEESAHQLALEAMAFTASLLVRLLPHAVLVSDRGQIERARAERLLPILHSPKFLPTLERDSTIRLPHTWDATSDSIAAWVAATLRARELVMLKSIDRHDRSWAEAARDGAVDPYFPVLAEKIPAIRWVNLRSAAWKTPSA